MSIGDTCYARPGDTLTACAKPTRGKDGVLFRTDDPRRTTCPECRARKRFRGAIEKSAKNIAAAGKVLERAVAKYGGIGHYQKRK